MLITLLLLFIAYVCIKCYVALFSVSQKVSHDATSSLTDELDEARSNIYGQLIDAGLADLIPHVSLELVDAERHEVELKILDVPEEQQQAVLSAIRGTGLRMLDMNINQNDETLDNMEKDKPQVTNNFNAPIYNYGTLQGDVTNNYYGDSPQKPHTEKEVRDALLELMKAKNEDGQLLFHNGYQWYGVLRVLSEFHDYPSAPKDFERIIANLNLEGLTYPCKYDNFRRIPTDCPRLAKPNVWLWKDLKASASGKELEVIEAALKLMELLKV